MNMNGPTPEDLGGFQNVCIGNIQEGDLLIHAETPEPQYWAWAVSLIGTEICKLEGSYRVYRKIPVARQGGIDHPDPSTLPPEKLGLGVNFLQIVPEKEIAKTNDEGKPPLAMLPSAGIRAVAQVQSFGHKKYHDFHNFRKGIQHSRAISCAIRHLMAHMDGESKDPESGELHLAHAACRILFLIQNINDKTDIDDRFKKG